MHEPDWPAFDIPQSTIEFMRKQLPEAPPSLFRSCLPAALNVLERPCTAWLETPAGKAFTQEHVGLTRIQLKLPDLKQMGDSAYGVEADDYAAGW